MVAPTLSKTKAEVKPQERPAPQLENGDHLTRAEFERRYASAEHIKKAELIEGVAYVPSPVSLVHSHYHAIIMGWLLNYSAATPGLRLLDNATVILDRENEVQPDAALCVVKGGQTRVVGAYIHGAPELVVEIAVSSASYDLHEKLRVYRRSGVQEYLVLPTLERQTMWYRMNEGRYDFVEPGDDGLIRSTFFPGLFFDPQRFWSDDPAGLLAALQLGLASPEHAAFAATLAGAQP